MRIVKLRAIAFAASLCIGGPALAADSTVTNLPAASALSGSELFLGVQSAASVKVTGNQIKTLANTSCVVAHTTTTEAVASSSQNCLNTFSNTGATAASIAQAGTGSFTTGWATSLLNVNTGTVTLTPTTSTINGAATLILLPGQGCDLYSDGTNYFCQGGRGTIVAKGTLALATSAISSAACTSAQTLTATGVVTTDIVLASFNGDPTAVTGYVPLTSGMLTIIVYPTANTINVKVCNNTTGSITPGAITLNLSAVR